MRQRQWILSFALLLVAGLLTTGCDKLGQDETTVTCDPQFPPVQYCGEVKTVRLMAGKCIDAGTVTVMNTPDSIYVTFITKDGWRLSETHVAIATTLEGIPHNRYGQPIPGQFPYKACHRPTVTGYRYAIPIGDWEPGDNLYIATHAVVKKGCRWVETAWGEGTRFPGKCNWGMYFMYEVQKCCCPLPHGPIHVNMVYPGAESYWEMTFSGIDPDNFAVRNGVVYTGWCVDEYITIQPGEHDFPLWCSYSSHLPSYLQDSDWDMVNYIINHKNPAAEPMDIQAAIWYFIDGGNMPTDPEAVAMVNDALANGEGFVPAYCQLRVAILDAGEKLQCTIIEVPACGALCCEVLPQGPLDVYLAYPVETSYWGMTFQSIPDGFGIKNKYYLGWCVDERITIQQNQWYQFPVWCTNDPDLPSYIVDKDWPFVNWIINHKHPDATVTDIQQAIWYFIDGGIMPTDPEAVAMVEDALANGKWYRPGLGELCAIAIDAGDKLQCTFIEVSVDELVCTE